MKAFMFYLIQFTWGALQNLAGGLWFLVLYPTHRHERFHYGIVTYVPESRWGSASMGVFLFVVPGRDEARRRDLCIHEYGHSIQSLVLGPLWLPVIGLVSSVWARSSALRRWRRRKGVSYYSLYCERWANAWGRAWSGEDFRSPEFRQKA